MTAKFPKRLLKDFLYDRSWKIQTFRSRCNEKDKHPTSMNLHISFRCKWKLACSQHLLYGLSSGVSMGPYKFIRGYKIGTSFPTSKGQHKLKEFHGTVNLGFRPHHLPFEVRPCWIRRSWPNLKRRSLPRLPWSNAAMHRIEYFSFAQRDWKQAHLKKKLRLKTTVTNLCSKGSTRMMEHLIVPHSTCICKIPAPKLMLMSTLKLHCAAWCSLPRSSFQCRQTRMPAFLFAQVTRWNSNSNAVTNPQNLKARSSISTQPWYLNFRACEKPCLHTYCLRNRYWTFWPLHPDIAKKKLNNQGAFLAPGPMDPPQIARLLILSFRSATNSGFKAFILKSSCVLSLRSHGNPRWL